MSGRPPALRWPFADLDQALTTAGYRTRAAKIEALGIPGQHPERTWWRWRRDGVPDEAADEVAIRLDLHPALIWTDWHLAAELIDDDEDGFVTAPLREDDVA